VRDRLEGDLGAIPLSEAIAKLRGEIDAKTVRQVAQRQPVVVAERESQNEY
jgi:threonyl-tRNA synthetase